MLHRQSGLTDTVTDLQSVSPHAIERHAVRDAGEAFLQHSIQLLTVAPDGGAFFRQSRERFVQQVCELFPLQINAVLP